MLKVVSRDEMRRLEDSAAVLGLPGLALMENPGRAVSDVVSARHSGPPGSKILVLAGPGNNGGDGLVAARHLHDAGNRVSVYLVNRTLIGDAKEQLLSQRQIRLIESRSDIDHELLDVHLSTCDLLVDSILGAGHSRPVADPLAGIFSRVRAVSQVPIVAVDLPSGINADTGEANSLTIPATWTVSLGHPKRGLLLEPAARYVGELIIADIGLPNSLSDDLKVRYADARLVEPMIPSRPRVSHKGSFGRVLIVAGSRFYTGAPILAALGAVRVGAGLVTLACPASIRSDLATHLLEATFLPLGDEGSGELGPGALAPIEDRLTEFDAVLVGPGIGRSKSTERFLSGLLASLKATNLPTIIDADGLSILATWPSWWSEIPGQTILTPHPGEMGRLLAHEVGADRIDVARQSAATWGAIVLLKGAYTVVATPDGTTTVLPFANSALATAGTGDVLGGTILGLLAQGATFANAPIAGAFLHGIAGGYLATEHGAAGGLASEIAGNLPRSRLAVYDNARLGLESQSPRW